MVNTLKKSVDMKMSMCLKSFNLHINKISTGRVSTHFLDGIAVEYYGSKMLLNKLANIIVEKSNTLKISVFDDSIIKNIAKAITKSHLEVNPIISGNSIRIIIPPLTEERRIKFTKTVRLEAEQSRIVIRNIRRDANDVLKKYIKDNMISKDLEYGTQNEIQLLTDSYISEIDNLVLEKELEIMKF